MRFFTRDIRRNHFKDILINSARVKLNTFFLYGSFFFSRRGVCKFTFQQMQKREPETGNAGRRRRATTVKNALHPRFALPPRRERNSLCGNFNYFLEIHYSMLIDTCSFPPF